MSSSSRESVSIVLRTAVISFFEYPRTRSASSASRRFSEVVEEVKISVDTDCSESINVCFESLSFNSKTILAALFGPTPFAREIAFLSSEHIAIASLLGVSSDKIAIAAFGPIPETVMRKCYLTIVFYKICPGFFCFYFVFCIFEICFIFIFHNNSPFLYAI